MINGFNDNRVLLSFQDIENGKVPKNEKNLDVDGEQTTLIENVINAHRTSNYSDFDPY